MTYTVERPSTTQITINVRVPYVDVDALQKRAAEKLSREIELEGFRKGKAPFDVIQRHVGDVTLLEEAARLYIIEHYSNIIGEVEREHFKEKSFELVGDPAISVTKLAPANDVEYRITLTILPPITLPDYHAIAKRVLGTRNVPVVTEAEVASSLNWLRESRSKLITINRPAAKGDHVEIDFSGSVDGVRFEGGESKNHPLVIGKGQLLPGFEDALIGMRAGEEKHFTVHVPAGHPDKRIAGKSLSFQVTMRLVQERDLPTWDDAFAKSLGDFSTIGEVETSVRQGLQLEKEKKERERLRIAIAEAIAAETKAEIPAPLIERELEKMIGELEQSMSGMGMPFDDYLTSIKKTRDDLKREWRGDAEHRVRIALALREIARREKIEASDEEIETTLSRTISRFGITEDQLKALDREAFIDYNRGIARNEKVFQFLENLESRN